MGTATNDIIIKINAETTKATADIKRLNAQVAKMQKVGAKTTKGLQTQTKAIDQTSRSFASLTKHISQLAIIYGAFQGLQTTVRTFANFEESVTRLGVVSGATSTQLSALEDEAKHLGETTIFTASQVADGMNAMAMAGLTAEESLAGISSTLDLSAVGMISVEEASLIATTAMNGFKLEAEDIGRISDVMAKTVTTSATTVQELGNAYEKVASVSTQFNVSLETTTASLGVLADAGRRGSEAGTQLKIVMNRMAGNKEASKFIKELGVNIYDTNGKILPFTTQLQNMKVELDKLDEQSRNIKMAEIFGTEALASANILLGDIDAVIAKTVELENAYGFASSSAKKMMDNLSGDYKEFQSALEGLILKIGEELSPILREALDDATEFLQTLDSDEIAEFGEGVGELVELMFDLVKSVLGVLDTIKDLSTVFASITGISGAMQVQLLLLGKGLTVLYGVGTKLAGAYATLTTASKAQIIANRALAISGTKVTVVTKALTVAQIALNKAMKANPIGLLLVGVASLVVGYQFLSGAYDDVNKAVKKTDDALMKNNDLLSTTKQEMLDLNTAGRQAFNDYNRDQINKTEKAIEALTKQITIEKEEWFTNHTWVAKNEAKLKELFVTKEGLLKQEKVLVGVNKESIAITKKKNDEIIAEAEATKALIKEKEALGEEETKAYNKAVVALNKRVQSGQDALLSLYGAEQKHKDKILKLENDIAEARKKFSDERLNSTLTLEGEVYDIKQLGLSDLKKYNQDALEIEKYYQLAKEAIKSGSREEAIAYQAKFNELRNRYNGEAITHEEKKRTIDRKTGKEKIETITRTDIAQQQASARAIGYAKYEDELNKGISTNDLIRTEGLIAKEKELANVKLQATRDQIQMKLDELKLLVRLQEIASNVKINVDFSNFENSLKRANQQLVDVANTDRKAKLKIAIEKGGSEAEIAELQKVISTPVPIPLEIKVADKAKVKKEADEVAQEIEKPKEVHLSFEDFKKAKTEARGLKAEAEKPIEANYSLLLDNARANYQRLRKEAETDTSAEHKLKLENAYKALSALRIYIRNNPITQVINVRYNYGAQNKQVGGLIHSEPNIQKFNTGGHARKTGALGGYGGGDKVKALLEAGEFIVRKEAVKSLGLDRLYQINQGRLPKYQTGGVAGQAPLPRFNTGGSVSASKTVNLNLNIGSQSFTMMADEDVAMALERYTRKNL